MYWASFSLLVFSEYSLNVFKASLRVSVPYLDKYRKSSRVFSRS